MENLHLMCLFLLIFGTSLASSLPVDKNEDSALELERNRRQTLLTKPLFNQMIREVIASGDRAECRRLCQRFGRDQRTLAMRSRFRGPYAAIRNFRAGATTLFNRYFAMFSRMASTCVQSFCRRITPPPPTSTPATPSTSTASTTTTASTITTSSTITASTTDVTTLSMTATDATDDVADMTTGTIPALPETTTPSIT